MIGKNGNGKANGTQKLSHVPRHVAIIMDGNGRWAEARGLARSEGHAKGARAVRASVETAREQGVEFLTLYAFSIANWARPRPEIERLMELLVEFADKEKRELRENGVRVRVVGELDDLPTFARRAVEDAIAETADCQDMTLTLALSYGGRRDIVDAARALAVRARAGLVLPEEIDEDFFHREMSTREIPDVDLLIRTGGESRVSDFLLFEAAYAELMFLPIMWPDFDDKAFVAALDTYAQRERRFGKTSTQVKEGFTFDPLDRARARAGGG